MVLVNELGSELMNLAAAAVKIAAALSFPVKDIVFGSLSGRIPCFNFRHLSLTDSGADVSSCDLTSLLPLESRDEILPVI